MLQLDKLVAKVAHPDFFAFVLAGAFAALVNIATRVALNLVMPFEIAVVAAYFCGMTTAFLLNRKFVFSPSGRSVADEYARFFVVNLFALAQVFVISVGLARLLFPAIGFTWHAATVAHAIGVIVPVFSSYIGHKYFSFGRAA